MADTCELQSQTSIESAASALVSSTEQISSLDSNSTNANPLVSSQSTTRFTYPNARSKYTLLEVIGAGAIIFLSFYIQSVSNKTHPKLIFYYTPHMLSC